MNIPHPLHILIIDPEEAHSEAMCRVLRSSAMYCNIDTGTTLKDYRRIVAEGGVALTIINMDLPDGIAAEILVNPPENGSFPVLVTTSFGNERIAVETLKAGAIDFLVKSTEAFHHLPRTITRILREWDLLSSRKTTLQALKSSEERFRNLIELAPDGMVLCDHNGMITQVNSSTLELTGRRPEELIGIAAGSLWDKTFPKELTVDVGHAKCITRPDGSVVYVENHSKMMPDGSYQMLMRDISERISAQEERISMERQLQHMQKLESLGVLAGGIAHDFNNLLTVIIGNLDLSICLLEPESELEPLLTASLQSARKAADLTHHMLDYAGQGRFVDETIQVNTIIRESESMVESMISGNAKLKFELTEDIPTLYADPSQIQQLIINILVNAAEAQDKRKGNITLTTGVQHVTAEDLKDSVLREKANPGLFVHIKVTDTGCGMDEETKSKVFDPFFSTKFTGRGLGMSAVMGIVRRYHGAIMLESRLNEGTTVTVLFPVKQKSILLAEQSAVHVPITEIPPQKQPAFLVVDDEDAILQVTGVMLQEMNYDCVAASTGAEAYAKSDVYGASLFGAIIDLTLPDINGRELYDVLSAKYPHMHFIFTSGYQHSDIRSMLPDGNIQFIQKPFSLDEFFKVISRINDSKVPV